MKDTFKLCYRTYAKKITIDFSVLSGKVSSTTNGATSKGNEIIHFSDKFRYFWVKDSKVLTHLNLRDLYENFTLAQLASFSCF